MEYMEKRFAMPIFMLNRIIMQLTLTTALQGLFNKYLEMCIFTTSANNCAMNSGGECRWYVQETVH